MKKFKIVITIVQLCLVLFACVQPNSLLSAEAELSGVLEASEDLPEELVNEFAEEIRRIAEEGGSLDELSEQQLSIWSHILNEVWGDADRNSHRVDGFEDISDELSVVIEFVNRNRESIENFESPVISVHHGDPFRISPDIPISDRETESLMRAAENFQATSHSSLDVIVVHPGRVSFHTELCRSYALIYTEDDSEPTFMMWPHEDIPISVERIQANWFHVFAR